MDEGKILVIRPAIPDSWSGFRVEIEHPSGSGYHLEVVNPERQAGEVVEARLDGAPVPVVKGAARVPLTQDGAEHRVVVVLGAKVRAGHEIRGAERTGS
ncbi:MAG: hypothetical protein E6K78_08910 [Candidatus Eisenbacteria bacterium]|uniref:Uncharacterized protein n=1 Tax=Eiseniibacteriota bacterium TaxID=2212470 RepID=A0A538TLT0_UNCEI|nr:MAG: hypothetical protein E6K78_08910 [Candidatus Eisenbacteria bacterium]